MFNLNKIQDNSIIITPNSIKKDILLETNKLDLNIKFMSKGELEQNTFFSCGDEALVYLMNKGISYANAKEILNNLYYLVGGNEKLDYLMNIKEELKEHHLLKYNFNFKQLFIGKKVYIYNYSKLDLELKLLLKYNDVQYEYLDESEEKSLPLVYKFDGIEEEVDHMFNMISETLDKNPSLTLNDIKLYKYAGEYDLIVKKYASFYHLPINFKKEMKLVHSPYFKMFLEKYDELSLKENYEYLVDNIKVDNYNFLNKIKNLLIAANNLFEDKMKALDYIKDKASETYLSLNDYEEGIELVDYNYAKDDYIFILGFNLLNFPKINKDVSFLNDETKKLLGINTTEITNKIEEENLVRFIKSHSHLTISYKEHIGKEVFYPSLLISKLGIKEISNYDYSTSYSLESLKNRTCIANDLKDNYGILNENLESIEKKDLDYKTYDHHFKPFVQAKRNKVHLSPSSLTSYYECPFKYYLQKVLYVNDFEENFSAQLGTFFHALLEESTKVMKKVMLDNKEIDNYITMQDLIKEQTDQVVEDYRLKIDVTFKEAFQKYIVSRLIEQIRKVVDLNTSIMLQNRNLDVEVEFKDEIVLDEHTSLEGRIDKMIYSNEEDHKYLLIIDYKTGSTAFEQEKMQYGLSLQLPIYSLIESVRKEDFDQLGIYIQNILDQKQDLRLRGITKNDEDAIIRFEPGFSSSSKSEFIYGVARTSKKDGFEFKSDNKTLFTKEQFEEIRKVAREKVLEASRKIRNGEFKIAPYYIDYRDNGCHYCAFKDLCFKEKEDIIYLNKDSKESDGED